MHAVLALEDGTVFHGESFGGTGTQCGEAVFNISMTGYQQILTAPSYKGQFVTLDHSLHPVPSARMVAVAVNGSYSLLESDRGLRGL